MPPTPRSGEPRKLNRESHLSAPIGGFLENVSDRGKPRFRAQLQGEYCMDEQAAGELAAS